MANVITPEFRVSFPNLFKPRLNELSKQEEYSVVALFKKDADLKVLRDAAQAAVEKKWGKDPAKWPKKMKTPFRDQGERAKEVDGKTVLPAAHEEGAIFLNLKSKMKPGVVDQTGKNEITDETQIYAGCYARAVVSCYAYDQAGNRGVSFGLQHVQKLRDGEALGGRVRLEDAFEPVAVTPDMGDGSAAGLFN